VELLTRQAWEVLTSAQEITLRTSQHPVVAGFPADLHIQSFDELYEKAPDFEAVYQQIVENVLELGRRPQGVIYAVPGHPFIAESTGPEIYRRAKQDDIPVRVIEGLSFIEPVCSAIGQDILPQVTLVDALELAARHTPSFPTNTPAIIAQIHSRQVASELKLTLMALYPDEHPVTLVHAAGAPQQRIEELRLYEIDRSPHIGLLTALYLPSLAPGASFEEFVEVIARLRAPDGCPWDREQDHLSLRPYLLEEAYEALAALDAADPAAMREEFGDLLLQIVLHAQIASETGEFNIADVLRSIHDKLIYRHPHVFGDLELQDVGGVLQNWERLKQAERQANGNPEASLLDGMPIALPALVQASEYQKRAARVGFDWPEIHGVLAKIAEELQEVQSAAENEQAAEIGDLLFSIVNLARWKKIDAEMALRQANARFRQRFAFIETKARFQGKSVSDLSLEELEVLWQQAKT
jgi:tetrapyrrole methylase family protein/MazG family protein